MKKIILTIIFGLAGLFLAFCITIFVWIDIDVKRNIQTAKAMYPGTAEEALIAYLLDTTHTPRERTRIAVYSLGQINSQKAIPILEEIYQSFPEGETCAGRHDTVICQYGISKALKACKSNAWLSHSRLNK